MGKKKSRLNHYQPQISPPQLFLYNKIKQRYKTAELNKEIKTDKGYRYADVAIQANGLGKTKYKIDIEYDGYLAHRNRMKQDRERDLELFRAGWITIRVNKENVDTVFDLIDGVIKNVSDSIHTIHS